MSLHVLSLINSSTSLDVHSLALSRTIATFISLDGNIYLNCSFLRKRLIERGTLFQFHQKHSIISIDGDCPLVQLVAFQNLVFHAVMKHYMNRSLYGTLIRTVPPLI